MSQPRILESRQALTVVPAGASERHADLLELACSTARLGVFERDLRTGEGRWSRELFELRGLSGETEAPPFEEAARLVIDADRAHFDAAMRGSLLPRRDPVRRQHFRLRYRVHAPDGSIRYLHKQWIVRYGDDGTAEQLRGVVMDDTPSQTLPASQGGAAAEIDIAADLTGMACWRQDLATGRVQLNAHAAALFGVEQHATALPLLRLHMGLHPDDREAAAAADAAALADGRPVDVELRCRDRAGGWRRLLTRRGVQTDAAGKRVTLVGVVIDTAERPAAAPLPIRGAMLPQDPVASYRFLSRVSHELRTPMNAVLGFARLLSYQESVDSSASPARSRALGFITEAGQHLMALINDVLDLSRIEGGEMPLTLAAVRLDELTVGILAMLDIDLRTRGMVVQTSGLGVGVMGDATRLRQVLLNLVGNAIKYGRAGGSIRIDAAAAADGVYLRVADDGRGMSEEQLRHLFEPFNRLGAEAAGIEGTGLGLSITRALVERMGGRVQAHSQPGQGTVFELRLLAAAAPPGDPG